MVAALTRLSEIERALSAAKTLHEVLDVRDKIVGVEAFIKAAGVDKEIADKATVHRFESERKAGDLLAKMDKKVNRHSSGSTMEQLGIDRHQSHRWQRMASLSEKTFREWVAEVRESGKELTANGLLRLAAPPKKKSKSRNLFECLSLLHRLIVRLYLRWPEKDRSAMADQLRNLAMQIDDGTLFTEDQG